jgi:hypothetical protein
MEMKFVVYLLIVCGVGVLGMR